MSKWEAAPPGYTTCGRAWRRFTLHAMSPWQPRKAGKIWECWQVKPGVGGVGNGVGEEDSGQDLNPGMAAMRSLTMRFWGANHMVLGLPLPCGLGRKRARYSRNEELS